MKQTDVVAEILIPRAALLSKEGRDCITQWLRTKAAEIDAKKMTYSFDRPDPRYRLSMVK